MEIRIRTESLQIVLGLLEVVVWYIVIYRLLLTLKNPDRNLWIAAAILLALLYPGFALCPWVRQTPAWQRL